MCHPIQRIIHLLDDEQYKKEIFLIRYTFEFCHKLFAFRNMLIFQRKTKLRGFNICLEYKTLT